MRFSNRIIKSKNSSTPIILTHNNIINLRDTIKNSKILYNRAVVYESIPTPTEPVVEETIPSDPAMDESTYE
jgi:hypothetical protein